MNFEPFPQIPLWNPRCKINTITRDFKKLSIDSWSRKENRTIYRIKTKIYRIKLRDVKEFAMEIEALWRRWKWNHLSLSSRNGNEELKKWEIAFILIPILCDKLGKKNNKIIKYLPTYQLGSKQIKFRWKIIQIE